MPTGASGSMGSRGADDDDVHITPAAKRPRLAPAVSDALALAPPPPVGAQTVSWDVCHWWGGDVYVGICLQKRKKEKKKGKKKERKIDR